MAASGSTKVIVTALAANALIAASKFAAAAWTGSAAMLSEAIHSLADTANQGLLLHGVRRAARPADDRHPFGHSRELYFWAFVVAILLFSLGAGVAIYEGVSKLSHPHPITDPWLNYGILGVALLFEVGSTVVAMQEFNRQREGLGVLEALRASKDPGLFTVLLENVAAIVGLCVALVGIAGSHFFGWTYGDAIASIIIGIILGLVAAFMSIETKALLIGEAAAPAVVAGIRAMIECEMAPHGPIRQLHHLKTMHLGPEDVIAAATLTFDETAPARTVQETVARLERRIQTRWPLVRHLYLEADVQPGAGGITDKHAKTSAVRQPVTLMGAAAPSADKRSAPSADHLGTDARNATLRSPHACAQEPLETAAIATADQRNATRTASVPTSEPGDRAAPASPAPLLASPSARTSSSESPKRNYPPPKKGKGRKRRR